MIHIYRLNCSRTEYWSMFRSRNYFHNVHIVVGKYVKTRIERRKRNITLLLCSRITNNISCSRDLRCQWASWDAPLHLSIVLVQSGPIVHQRRPTVCLWSGPVWFGAELYGADDTFFPWTVTVGYSFQVHLVVDDFWYVWAVKRGQERRHLQCRGGTRNFYARGKC
jgi:hypothetical protein